MNALAQDYPYLAACLRAVLVFAVVLNIVPILIYLERRICAFIQDRIGPNRVGPMGLLQPLADAIKLILKEDLTPRGIDRAIYTLAPFLVFAPATLAFAVIPAGINLEVASLNIGVIFVITVGSLGVYGIAFGGWASNNKYSLLGGLRASAQMISYEIALGLSLLCVIVMSQSVDLNQIVRDQHAGGWLGWYLFQQPLAAITFSVAAFAETNRLPFDLPECEAELVGGFHTEYTSMKFAMFFMGEYVAMITMSALIVTLFLGGWSLPFVQIPAMPTIWDELLSVVIFGAKLSFILLFFIWVRWTLPRFRYDQLMRLGWKFMIPLSLVMIAVTASLILLGWKDYIWLASLILLGVVGLALPTAASTRSRTSDQEHPPAGVAGASVGSHG